MTVLNILHSASMQNTILYCLVPDCSSIALAFPIFYACKGLLANL